MEKPIIFNGEMVRAILNLIKTQTRRVTGFERINKHLDKWKFIGLKTELNGKKGLWAVFLGEGSQSPIYIKCPWEVGTHLWVRETFKPVYHPHCEAWENVQINYKAGGSKVCESTFPQWPLSEKWKSSIHMPHFASRITLEVKEIRVERLQDISEDDAEKEGVNPYTAPAEMPAYKPAFADLWDKINYDRGYGWDVNPWVWVISFERI